MSFATAIRPATAALWLAGACLLALPAFASEPAASEPAASEPSAATPTPAEPAVAKPEPARPPASGPPTLADFVPSGAGSVALFLTGAATAFVAHESCHVFANFAFGLVPDLEPVKFMGAIPFFAISPPLACDDQGCTKDDGSRFGAGRAGMYTIVASGLQCQQLANEIILSTDPALLHREAPFRKGVLAFNVVLSLGYAIADWAGVEPTAGDLSTLERLTGMPRGAIAAAVFVPAVLDALRFFFPDSPWLPWAGRLSKGAIFGFYFAF